MSKNKKAFTILGLTIAVIILVGAIFTISQPSKQSDPNRLPDGTIGNVTVGGIDGEESGGITAREPSVTPGRITDSARPEQDGNPNEIILTQIEDRPEPPELPNTAYTGEPTDEATPEDVEAHQALDPVLTNPDVKPNITPPSVTPARPSDNTPQGGTTNDKGEVYVPGFGWIPNSGANDGKPSGSDGDWDKQIGNM